jgi:hypothetical protein
MRNLVLLLASVVGLTAADKPNVLFLLSDDHSYPYLSCYGDANVRTPALDKLAAEGMKFRRFFTSAPQCVPSRAAYLSGRSPVAARITRFSSPLPRDVLTFPEVLRKEAGYYVGVVGRSYHLDGSMGKGDDGLGKFLFDGGQSVVTAKGTVIAVEAFEGTDNMLRRCVQTGGKEMLLTKTAKHAPDWRFDVPCFGLKTLESMAEGGVAKAALEADAVILIDKPAVIARAKQLGIDLFGFGPA